MAKYDHKKVEAKWQSLWEEAGIYNTDLASNKEKFYNLIMFPYPSGSYLHIGHAYSFGGADVYGRYKRLNGLNTFMPIGYDAFGLPAENFAIKNNVHPKVSTAENIRHAEKQLKSFGYGFDWSKTVNTSDPSYYKWTQWLFLKLYEQGLAYQKEAPVNWCPKCMTVLANEQVVNRLCERCDTEVVQKKMTQWFFKTTDYAERLINDFDKVDWPESSKAKQKNWIGRSEGSIVKFEIRNTKSERRSNKEYIEIFTTRVDTIFGCTYMVVAPEHPIVQDLTTPEQKKEVESYIVKTQKLSELDRQLEDREKTGVFTGSYAINPFNGEKVPVWISDYVIYGYGTGAVMAVPAHDERDWEFAKKFGLEIRQSILPSSVDFNKLKKLLDIVKQIKERADKDNLKFWLLGSLATAFHQQLVYRNYADIDLLVRSSEDEEKIAEIIENLGIAKTENKKLTDKLTIKIFQNNDFEINLGTFVGEFGMKNEDFEGEKEFLGTKVNVVSLRFLKDFKEQRLKENDKKDLEFLEKGAITDYGNLIDSGEFTGLSSEEAKQKMNAWLSEKNLGGEKITYRLRDWSFSRQRYWGAPIPVIYCHNCLEGKRRKEKGKSEEEFNISIRDGKEYAIIPVPEADLPVELPEIEDFRPKGSGKGPLASVPEFMNTTCPKCGGKAEREADTMDTFVCSSFYFLRYPSANIETEMMNKEITQKWLPVDMYIGGAEHVTMHLLYARFITKALFDAGLIAFDEPFKTLRHQGMILGPDGKKMSKSRGNVIIPDEIIKEYGADAFRLSILFMGQFEDGGPFNPNGLKTMQKLLDRIWNLSLEITSASIDTVKNTELTVDETALARIIDKGVKKMGEDFENLKFNTAISTIMITLNELESLKKGFSPQDAPNAWREGLKKLILVLAPLTPHFAEEVWETLGYKETIFNSEWPKYDKDLIVDDVVTIAIQINGKVRAEVVVAKDASQEEILAEAQKLAGVNKYLEGKDLKKVIYIKGKLLSLVI